VGIAVALRVARGPEVPLYLDGAPAGEPERASAPRPKAETNKPRRAKARR
jgi:hypothetical protein